MVKGLMQGSPMQCPWGASKCTCILASTQAPSEMPLDDAAYC